MISRSGYQRWLFDAPLPLAPLVRRRTGRSFFLAPRHSQPCLSRVLVPAVNRGRRERPRPITRTVWVIFEHEFRGTCELWEQSTARSPMVVGMISRLISWAPFSAVVIPDRVDRAEASGTSMWQALYMRDQRGRQRARKPELHSSELPRSARYLSSRERLCSRRQARQLFGRKW